MPGLEVFPRDDFLTHQLGRFPPEQRAVLEQETLRQLTAAQATNLAPPLEHQKAPVSPESRGLGLALQVEPYQALLRLLVDEPESGAEHLHLVFTENAIGSWRGDDVPFVLHILCLGEPAIISTTGLVEALPRPREYHFRRAQFTMLGLGEDALEELADDFADRTFGYGDPRINELCKGYALMACFYRMFGEAFCDDEDCRLHAARSQEEMIELQCGPGVGLCERHRELLAGRL
jgi:hypothetical protein